MSDLQVSLLVIGVLVVGGVTAFNRFQEARLRRRLEREFGETLHRAPTPREESSQEASDRLEPQWGATRTPEPSTQYAAAERVRPPPPLVESAAQVEDFPPVPGFEPAIDYVAAIDAAEPISAAGLAELHTRVAASGRRFRIAGFNEKIGEWEEAGRLSGARYAHLRIAVQLVSRKGVADVAALSSVCDAVRACASRFSALARCPDLERALEAARELDVYCADVDVSIGVNIVPAPGTTFAGTRIRALAESAGFKLEPDGVFHFRDSAGHTLFSLDNQEPAPFIPEQIKHLTTSGVTLLLDVPRVADGDTALEAMIHAGAQLASELGGTLVDDNRAPLSDGSARAIRQQLHAIRTKMEARGMSPGGERALRLFS